MLKKIQDFKSHIAGSTVFIVGGGPSINDNTIKELNKTSHKIICINSACKFVNNPFAVMWCDDSWGIKNSNYLNNFNSWKFLVKNAYISKNYYSRNITGQSNSLILSKTGDYDFDTELNCVRGNNTGTNALNFVANCGASKICLVGFDMGTDGNKTHFHKEYTFAIKRDIYPDVFLPSINSVGTAIQKHLPHIKIYNCSRFSKLELFEYKPLKELI